MTPEDRMLRAMCCVEMHLIRVTPEWWVQHPEQWRSFLVAVNRAWRSACALPVSEETIAAVNVADPNDPASWPDFDLP